jgi:hypothetical protein
MRDEWAWEERDCGEGERGESASGLRVLMHSVAYGDMSVRAQLWRMDCTLAS